MKDLTGDEESWEEAEPTAPQRFSMDLDAEYPEEWRQEWGPAFSNAA